MTADTVRKVGKTVLTLEIDCDELACRIFEAMNDMPRPVGFTARMGLGVIKQTDPKVYAMVMRASAKAAEYVTECFNSAKEPS